MLINISVIDCLTDLKTTATANTMFMQLGFKWCIHLYYNLLSFYYFDSAVASTPQLHKHLTLSVIHPAAKQSSVGVFSNRKIQEGKNCFWEEMLLE
jgi:hypothetical protein